MLSNTPALEQLLYVATVRGGLSWSDWKDACRSLSAKLDDGAFTPATAAQVLDELAHVELVTEGGRTRITAAPAILVRLPKAGTAAAVLSGGRSPQAAMRLAEAASSHGAHFTIQSPVSSRSQAPAVLRIEAEDSATLTAVATLAEIPSPITPVAWTLGHVAGSVAAYYEGLSWRYGAEPSLNAREFNSRNGRYGPVIAGRHGLRLVQYYPRTHAPFWEIRDGERAAPTDRSWGIYICSSHEGRELVIHDRETNAVAIPVEMPLPRPFGRVLTLCSGEAPEVIKTVKEWSQSVSETYYVYRNVPSNVADLILKKLDQSGLPFHIPARNTCR